MMRRQHEIRTQFLRLLDAGLFGICFWVAYQLRANIEALGDLPLRLLASVRSEVAILPFPTFLPMFILVVPIGWVVMENSGYYRRALQTSRMLTTWQILQGVFLVTLGLIFVMFALKTPSARGVVLLFSGISLVAMLAREEVYRLWLRARRSAGAARQNVLLVGAPADTLRLRRQMADRFAHDITIIDEIDLGGFSTTQLVELLHERAPNAVVLATEHTNFAQAEKVIRMCELEGVEVWLLADFFKTTISKTSVDEMLGRPMLVFHSAPEFSYRALLKRVMDVALSGVALAALSPLLAAVAVAIKLTSRGPVFYRDKRCGLNGRPFWMLKFRSMVSNAEQLKPGLEARNEMQGPVFKLTNDPRTTRIGGFMRKYSIDELPQLVNVLKGEMSLVGPRPLVVDEIRRFDDFAHRRRLSVKPGLTCLWQVNGRSNLRDFNDWMRMDLEYIDAWSLALDFKILLRTIPTVLSGNGAK